MTELVEHSLDAIGFGRFQWRLLFLCSAGYFAVCSELLLAVFLEIPLRAEFGLSDAEYAWFPFTVSLCSFMASLTAGKLADVYGRKLVFAASLALVCGAGFLCAISMSFQMVVALRSLVGVGTGGLAVVDYVVFQEFTPTIARGRYLYVVFVSGCLGVLYLAAIAAFTRLEWQWLVVLAALPTLPAGILRCLVATETPHYLAATGRRADAYAVLQLIGRTNRGLDRLPAEQEFSQQEMEVGCNSRGSRGALSSVLQHSPGRLAAPLAAMWLLQSTAYWGLTLFLPEFLASAGVPANRTIFAMIACELPGCAAAALLVDHPRVGRVWTLRLNFAVASVAVLVLSFSGQPAEAVISLSCLAYFSMIPNWAVLFLFTPEAYPTGIRGTAMGFFQTLQGIPSIFAPFISASLVERGNAYMLAWSACLFLALVSSASLPERHRATISLTPAVEASAQ